MLSQLEMVLKGGRVLRYHTKTLTRPETVAEHHHVVAWLATFYWQFKYGALPRAELLVLCLGHDLPEHVTGDIPAPAKRRVPGMREELEKYEEELMVQAGMPRVVCTAEEAEVLHFCDSFSGWVKCLYERAMGNLTLAVTEQRYLEYTYELLRGAEHLDTDLCEGWVAQLQREGVPS